MTDPIADIIGDSEHRPSRQAGAGQPGANIVIAGGVVSGAWSLSDDGIAVAWFAEARTLDEERLAQEVGRLSMILARPLSLSVQMA